MKEEFIKKYNENYKKNNLNSCIFVLLRLMMDYDKKINIGEEYEYDLKHFLFNANIIKNPMGIRYTEQDYNKTYQILGSVLKNCKKLNLNINEKILDDIKSIIVYTECLYNMNSVNDKRMEKCEINELSFEEQLMLIMIFFQDQFRLVSNSSKLFNKKYVTGMELSVANKSLNYDKNSKTSINDNFESTLESMNEIIRYLYYRFGKQMKSNIKIEDLQINDIRPYKNISFKEYLYISVQRYLLYRMEESVRYGYYSPKKYKKDDNIFYFFLLENEKKYAARRVGILRREYLIVSNVTLSTYGIIDEKEMQKTLEILYNKLINKQRDTQIMFDFSKYQPDKEYFLKLEAISNIKIQAVKDLTKTYYLKCSVGETKIIDLLTAYSYIYTISMILFYSSSKCINIENQETLIKEIGLIDISYLVKELTRIHGFKLEYSKKLIDKFIFHETNNKNDDIFSQPLVKISKKQIVLSHGLIDQVNLDRFIERQFISYDKNVSDVGREFEKEFINKLSNATCNTGLSNFQVNTNKIIFCAYDGREIEFDVILTLGNYLILTELKSIMTSYDINELKKREKNIDKAIEQLNRRKKSIKKDWKKIKELVSINLPEEPYDDDHIILIACTDAYDFTPIKKNEVFITDDSTYLKYFVSPTLELIEFDSKNLKKERIKNLWAKGYPDPKEFMEYLINPVTTFQFMKNIKKDKIVVPRFDKDDLLIYCEEYMLTSDPINKLVEKNKNDMQIDKHKIIRNLN